MIYNESFRSYSERTSSYLLRTLSKTVPTTAPVVREVAVAVEKYLELETGGHVVTLSDAHVIWMLAQALTAGGEPNAARAWLEHTLGPGLGSIAASCLCEAKQSDTWRLFASGLLRLTSGGFDQNPIWLVDLSRLRVENGHFYELSWVPGIRKLFYRVVELWDHAGRRGILALRGAMALAKMLHSRPTERLSGARQIEAACREAVLRSLRERVIEEPLRVVMLDTRVSGGHYRKDYRKRKAKPTYLPAATHER